MPLQIWRNFLEIFYLLGADGNSEHENDNHSNHQSTYQPDQQGVCRVNEKIESFVSRKKKSYKKRAFSIKKKENLRQNKFNYMCLKVKTNKKSLKI